MACAFESHAYVIFGATGSLSNSKLLPALFQLHCCGYLATNVKILGCGRTPYGRADWRTSVRTLLTGAATEDNHLEDFLRRLDYLSGDLHDPAFYQTLTAWVSLSECACNLIFYLAVSPELYAPVTNGLAQAGLLNERNGWRRMVIEKPFGHDLSSANDLQQRLGRVLEERQIYRIDHYVGKQSVQNLLVLRFANMILEPLWNRHYIDHVQITHAETAGVGNRTGYYDKMGATRDMIQSHLLQVLALLAMEPPVSLDAEAVRDEKVKVLRSIRPLTLSQIHESAVRAQYAGYLAEKGVAAASRTETYAALKLHVDNWRWRDVPFYLRTGKHLKEQRWMVAIRFREPPMQLFRDADATAVHPNWLLIGIQPEDIVRLEISARVHGLETRTRPIAMDASIVTLGERKADAYEELLLEVIQGNRSLFLRYDEVQAAWAIIDPLMQAWADDRTSPPVYATGTWGPVEADRLFGQSGRKWRQTLTCNADRDWEC
ncbi:glucose-6-phosphate dehydrogenase [Propionivibrio limicola]|uniref:glucose-6-phosphate dehydrogenase n=1 Tax=Propionivibrio limicola TaxID=167645 RepID=UPI001290CE9B|nr:glucose-6-phosphate dehydrogenase [Propionivibrio limicola]